MGSCVCGRFCKCVFSMIINRMVLVVMVVVMVVVVVIVMAVVVVVVDEIVSYTYI